VREITHMTDAPLPHPDTRMRKVPARALPILYFAWAHLCLATAFALLAMNPHRFAGFFYQAPTMAVVHLVTLGWISCSILGSLYIVGPLALRAPLPAGAGDHAAFALVAVGTLGVTSHFWIERFEGVGWGGVSLLLGIGWVAARLWRALSSAPIEGAIKAHVGCAFVNLLGSGIFGVLLGFDREHGLVGGSPMPNLFAHVHLAAIGWGAMMVAGVGYRLLPMVLPAAMPRGRSLWVGLVLLEAGTVGVFFDLLTAGRFLPVFAASAAAGLAVFLSQVIGMFRQPRPAPPELARPDFGALGAMQALAYLVLSIGMGLALAWLPISDLTLAPAAAYGVFGLVGFLSQMVAGIEARLLPIFAATHAIVRSAGSFPASPHRMTGKALGAIIFSLWTAGVPLLAAGFGLESAAFLAAGAWALLLAALLGALRASRILLHAYTTAPTLKA